MTVINVNTDVSVTRSNTVAVAQRQVKWDDFVLLYYALLWATACKILLTRSYWRYWENILFPFLSTGYFNNKFEYLLKFWFTVISTIKPAPKKKSPEPESKWSSILPLYLSSVATEQMNCAPWPTVRVILVNRSMPWRTHREKILSRCRRDAADPCSAHCLDRQRSPCLRNRTLCVRAHMQTWCWPPWSSCTPADRWTILRWTETGCLHSSSERSGRFVHFEPNVRSERVRYFSERETNVQALKRLINLTAVK